MLRAVSIAFAFSSAASMGSQVAGQPAGSAQYEVVSIKITAGAPDRSGMRISPDGSFTMTNQPIASIIYAASPVPVRDVDGFPDWVKRDRYDITAKAPAGSTREQSGEMMRNMLIDRLKVAGHVEDQERNTFALVVARRDGRLGPQLKPSGLDCSPPAAPPSAPPTPDQVPEHRCGLSMRAGTLISGGIDMNRLALSLSGWAGGHVRNATGLDGWYALTLRFAMPFGKGPAVDPAAPDDSPEFFTAIQEQLGLKLQPEKAMVPIFVIDHIERPTPN